ncbi:MAG: hypothetical protein AB7F78_03170 [Hyphomicrobiaceae bacterium]
MAFCARARCNELSDEVIPILPGGKVTIPLCKKHAREWQSGGPRLAMKTKAPKRRRWYPIECEHGFDCCPQCDGARRDPRTLETIE